MNSIRPLISTTLFVLMALNASVAHAAAASKTNAAPANASAEVPLEIAAGRILLPVEIVGNKSMKAMYDTGAQGAMIAQSLVDELQLPIIGEAMVGSPAGGTPIPVKLVSLNRIKVGSYVANIAPMSTDAVVMDDAKFPAGIQLVIGNNQFPDALIEVNLAQSRFKLSKVGTTDTSNWQKMDSHGFLSGTLDIGIHSIPLHIDVGNPGYIDLPKAYADKLPLKSALAEKPGVSIKLVDRVLTIYSAHLDSPATLAGTPIEMKGAFNFADLPFANVGAKALKNARIMIDNTNKHWKLEFTEAGKPLFGE
jgi:Aspartyl protease